MRLLIKTAKDLSDNYLLGNKKDLNYQMLFLSMHLDRIADSLLHINNEQEKESYLNELLSGSLNFFERETSHAKDMWGRGPMRWHRKNRSYGNA